MTNENPTPGTFEQFVEELVVDPPDWLRAVVTYGDDGVRPQYFRNDVEEGDNDESLTRKAGVFGEMIERGAKRETNDGVGSGPFGKLAYQIRAYDSTVLIHVPRGESGGTVISLDGDALDALPAVIRCLGSPEAVGGPGDPTSPERLG